MGKGRWQPLTANRNRAGPQGQRLEPGNEHGLSEPCAVKSRMHGSSGGKGPRGPYLSQLFCETRTDAERAQAILEEWLSERGLTFSAEKTHIVHLSEGFNFLGFNIRHGV